LNVRLQLWQNQCESGLQFGMERAAVVAVDWATVVDEAVGKE
jgi:hypothetical protein